MKELVSEQELTKQISHIQFGLLTPNEMRMVSQVQVLRDNLFEQHDRSIVLHGPLDQRMGTSDKDKFCTTCNLKMKDCIGHFGHINLALPVFHIGFFKHIIAILHKICKTCSRVLMSTEEIASYTKKFRIPHMEALRRRELNLLVNARCRKETICKHCGSFNGPVKKVPQMALKLIHEKYKGHKLSSTAYFSTQFESVAKRITDIPRLLQQGKMQDDLTPLVVRELFRHIPDSDCAVLDLAEGGRPEDLILSTIAVPPVCIRPSIPSVDGSGVSNEDDITMTIREIMHMNTELKRKLADGDQNEAIMDKWEFLQLKCALIYNGELSGMPAGTPTKAIRGFSQRLKGKTGRFRGNLSGKRVDFSSRTVISPDPNLAIDELAVPKHVCKIMTYPERVNSINIERLRGYVVNGPEVHPGANHVIFSADLANDASRAGISSTVDKRFLGFGNRDKIADDLRIGDIVERHIIDGDVVLFNRQPSLHKMSIMAHQVKVRPWRTFRFNECVCNPYNADFDGDEMNMHVPQTEEARAEALTLMGTKSNQCTPRNGEPLICAIQDFITGAYLVTQKDYFLSKSQMHQMASAMLGGSVHVDLPAPAIVKPMQMWTGKQLITLMLQSSVHHKNMRVTLEKKTKAGPTVGSFGQCESMAPNDGYLVIFNSTLICGTLDKDSLGGSKKTIFYYILRQYSKHAAAEAMLNLARLACYVMQQRGFSIGVGDVTPSPTLREEKTRLLRIGISKCATLINEEMNAPTSASKDGTLEQEVSHTLSEIRTEAGQHCKREAERFCAPVVMARCGSKGSDNNIAQMIALVGQQVIGGKRIPMGFEERTLPHFPRHSADPDARGFVENSFFTGLTPTEFFFHTMAGREGLVDTAVKTAETGYMSRRLMKALEDLSTDYKLNVLNSSGSMIQFCYGDDGLDPTYMESGASDKPDKHGVICPLNLDLLWTDICHADCSFTSKPALAPFEMREVVEKILRQVKAKPGDKEAPIFAEVYSSPATQAEEVAADLDPWERHSFTRAMHAWVMAKAEKLAALRKSYNFPERLNRSPDNDVIIDANSGRLHAVMQVMRVTKEQLVKFLRVCARKYVAAAIEPGSAVGAVGAQSIGEPGTQMTLKTFHFAGLASMNITQGVPRIKEIINASKNISTPVITAPLHPCTEDEARRTQGRVARAHLRDVLVYIEEVYTAESVYLLIKIDRDLIKRLHLEVTPRSIAASIVGSKLKVKPAQISMLGYDRIIVRPVAAPKSTLFFTQQTLREQLPTVIIKGDKEVTHVILNKEEVKGEQTKYKLLLSGKSLINVISARGVIGTKVRSNHIVEIERALGIEAARKSIVDEMINVMESHGLTIDARHVMLLADLMTFKGEVLGITRFGIAKMKDSVFMLASFEKTADHLYDAALHGTKDPISGVSECIIVGSPMKIGSGMFKVLQSSPSLKGSPIKKRPLMFDTPARHVPFKSKFGKVLSANGS
eukprot:m.217186 g.217186  ORF g.217186 m.217186 type:complete len:1466 (-) comp33232_c0_seq1:105-4502(-)